MELGSVADWVAAGAGLISAVGVIWTLWYAVTSARTARHEMVEPVLTVEIGLPQFDNGRAYVLATISNIGTGPALAVHVRAEPGEGGWVPEPQEETWSFIPHFSPDYPEKAPPANVKSARIFDVVKNPDPWRKTVEWSFSKMPPGGKLTFEYRDRLGKTYQKTAEYTLVDGRFVCTWPK